MSSERISYIISQFASKTVWYVALAAEIYSLVLKQQNLYLLRRAVPEDTMKLKMKQLSF